jgi:phosphoglycerol transferase MdoB-like AlkP superfamily enzyme
VFRCLNFNGNDKQKFVIVSTLKQMKAFILAKIFYFTYMHLVSKIPKSIRFSLSVLVTLLLCMTAYRLFFFYHYRPTGKPFSGSMMVMGFRFDMRVASVVGLLLYFLQSLPFLNPYSNAIKKKIFIGIVSFIVLLFLIAYGSDFYYYDYLQQRLSAFILSFAQDAAISAKMMWQSYPVFKIVIALLIIMLLSIWLIKKLFSRIENTKTELNKKRNILFSVAYILISALAIFGKINQYPLRWSDAFSLSDDFKANVALNPFQSFFSTLSFKKSGYDLSKVKEGYSLITSYFGIKDTSINKLNYERVYTLKNTNDTINKPNIVIVICESFSAYKSSMFGNVLNTTPYFNSLSKEGVFFERCFTPGFGTARGVWATLTGIPDVEPNKTASRNPNAVNQHLIMNDFVGYDKYYFLGGSTTWANIRGVLTNNIDDLKIYEEGDYNAQTEDVWGISDKNLFLKANNVFAQQKKPFVSIIQTANNHEPYTIPTEDLGVFKKVEYPKDSLDKYGFDNNEQLNAFRYSDFCFQTFIETAKKENYFSNTIFVFVGDHGLRGNAGNLFPESYTKQGILAEHVPLLFYAPTILQPKKIIVPSSQLDIFPSVAFLSKQNFTNNTMGKNLFDSANNINRYAFIADPDMHTIGLVSNEYHYARNLNSGKIDFVSVINNNTIAQTIKTDSIKNAMANTTEAFYNTAKYLLLNNKKKH